MKKKTLVNGFLFVFLLLTAIPGNATNGQRIALGNWQNPMTMQSVDLGNIMTILLNQDHELYINLKIRTARTTYTGNPDFYLKYTFGETTQTIGPYNLSDFHSEYMYDENGDLVLDGNGDPIALLVFVHPVMLDFSEECANDADRSGIFELPVEIALLQQKYGNYLPYPILDYPQLFPIGLFEETSFPFSPPTFQADKYFDCDNFFSPQPANRKAESASEQETDFTLLPEGIHPNPFTDHFSLVYRLEKAEKVNLRLIDSRGKVVFEKRGFYKEAGLHEEVLEMAELLPGLYFVQWSTNERMKSSTAIKL